jgi:hypothetical protein
LLAKLLQLVQYYLHFIYVFVPAAAAAANVESSCEMLTRPRATAGEGKIKKKRRVKK